MLPWIELDCVSLPDGQSLALKKRGHVVGFLGGNLQHRRTDGGEAEPRMIGVVSPG